MYVQTYQERAEERDTLTWLLITIFTFGSGALLYTYLNFRDMRAISFALAAKSNGEMAKTTDPVFAYILEGVFPIGGLIALWKKHEEINKLQMLAGGGSKSTFGGLGAILMHLIPLIGPIWVYFSWQGVMNELIKTVYSSEALH